MRLLRNFVYRNGSRKINSLLHPFLWITLAFGVCFAFLPGVSGADQTALFRLTELVLPNVITSLWGLACVLVTLLNTGAFWIGLVAAALPNIYFWVWYYLAVRTYQAENKAGLL